MGFCTNRKSTRNLYRKYNVLCYLQFFFSRLIVTLAISLAIFIVFNKKIIVVCLLDLFFTSLVKKTAFSDKENLKSGKTILKNHIEADIQDLNDSCFESLSPYDDFVGIAVTVLFLVTFLTIIITKNPGYFSNFVNILSSFLNSSFVKLLYIYKMSSFQNLSILYRVMIASCESATPLTLHQPLIYGEKLLDPTLENYNMKQLASICMICSTEYLKQSITDPQN